MKIIIVKTGKWNKSTESEIDKTVNVLEKILFTLDKKLNDYKWAGCEAMYDRTQVVLER